MHWGLSSGRLGHGTKVGVVVSDEVSDQDALHSYLLPDLKKIGVDPQVVTITADVGETATTDSDATLAVERLKAAGVQSVIPLLPENAFTPYIGAETSQNYFPKLLLSDYQSEIEVALGLIPIPYEKALNGQEGVTAETLGGIDLPVPESQGGYDPGVRSCWTVWHKAYPQTPKGNINDDIEEQGPVQGWCQEIRLFAKAATMAGKNLNRRTFVEAMSHITNFPGGYSPVLSYGPDKFSGPTQYQVVEVHDNHPPTQPVQARAGRRPRGRSLLGHRADLEALAVTRSAAVDSTRPRVPRRRGADRGRSRVRWCRGGADPERRPRTHRWTTTRTTTSGWSSSAAGPRWTVGDERLDLGAGDWVLLGRTCAPVAGHGARDELAGASTPPRRSRRPRACSARASAGSRPVTPPGTPSSVPRSPSTSAAAGLEAEIRRRRPAPASETTAVAGSAAPTSRAARLTSGP